jgi:hypothetical protein
MWPTKADFGVSMCFFWPLKFGALPHVWRDPCGLAEVSIETQLHEKKLGQVENQLGVNLRWLDIFHGQSLITCKKLVSSLVSR